MREIVQAIRASTVPVIIYIAPLQLGLAPLGRWSRWRAHAPACPETAIGAASPSGVGPEGGRSECPRAQQKEIEVMQAWRAASQATQRQGDPTCRDTIEKLLPFPRRSARRRLWILSPRT